MALKNEQEPLVAESNNPSEQRLATVPLVDEEKHGAMRDERGQEFPDQAIMLSLPAKSQRRRRYLHALTNGALVQEFLFLFFQYAATQKGLVSSGVEPNSAAIASAILSLSDWLVNVLSVSVPADADSVLFPVKEQLLGRWAKIEFLIKSISLVGSYSFGAAADALPLLALVPSNLAQWQLGFINYLLIIVNIVPGATYYRMFNHAKVAQHIAAFKDFCNYPTLPLHRLYQKPINILRNLEVWRSSLSVLGYRAINFAFIAQALAPYLLAPIDLATEQQGLICDSLALLALSATAINVLFSRMLPTYEQFSALAYDVVSAEEYQYAASAWKAEAFSSKWQFFQRVGLLLLCAIPNLVTALGWALLTLSLVESSFSPWLMGALIGSMSFFNRSYVEYQAFIAKKAVISLVNQPTEISQRLFERYGLIQPNHPLVIDEVDANQSGLYEQLKIVHGLFTRLATNFASSNLWLNRVLMAINVGARVARTLGFYGFIKALAVTLNDYSSVNLSDQQIIALSLILAPENFKNELAVFDESMKEVISGWQAKCHIEQCKLGRALSRWEILKICLRKSPYDFSLMEIYQGFQQRRLDQSSSVAAPIITIVPTLPPPAPLVSATVVMPSQGLIDRNDYVPLASQDKVSHCALR